MLIKESNETSPLLQSQESFQSTDHILAATTSSTPSTDTRQSCGQRLRNLICNITVEPLLFLHAMSYAVASVFNTNMMVDKVCKLQLNYSQDVCDNLDSGDHELEQDAVQKVTSVYQLYCNWIESSLGIFVMVLLGAWSDTKGRKLPLIVPLVGDSMKAFLLLGNAYFWYWKPCYLILAYIPYGLGGGWMAIFMAAYAYVGNHSGNRSRTTRLSLTGLMSYAAWPMGHFMGALLYVRGGYVLVFGAQFVFSILTLIYGLLRFDSGPPPRREGEEEEGATRERKNLTLATVKKSLMAVFKPREGYRRAHIIAHVVCIWITMISYEGSSFTYLYTRKKFGWNYYDYTVWSILSTPISFLASCVILPILSYHFQLEDSLLGFIGSASHIFYGTIVGTAPRPWVLYLALVISSFSGMVITSSRGAISKLVDSNELGGVFTTIALGESVSPIVFSPLFTLIYNNTLESFPGAVFIVGSVIAAIVSCLYTWILTSGQELSARFANP
ncbi:proton-coupled folate transporter-like [Palaemon carinicauda]|uniref:proton-coupled folate transporter-like n=1 Tax=Palaemon carinicauda TaxID=392227 RepID=UPI0035B5B3AB